MRRALALPAVLLAFACGPKAPPPGPSQQAAPESAPAATASSAPNAPARHGKMTAEDTDAVLAGAVQGMQRCHVEAPAFKPANLIVTLHLNPSGTVGAVDYGQKVPKKFADCMTAVLATLQFPSGDQDVDFPLDLSQ